MEREMELLAVLGDISDTLKEINKAIKADQHVKLKDISFYGDIEVKADNAEEFVKSIRRIRQVNA